MIKLFTDAAVNGNPGQAGVGILILDQDKQKQITIPLAGNQWNNHEAEFKGLVLGLSWLIEHNKANQMTFAYTDSQIVAQSIEKEYVKDASFQKYLTQILTLMDEFAYINIKWIPESKNRGADNLARQALKKAPK